MKIKQPSNSRQQPKKTEASLAIHSLLLDNTTDSIFLHDDQGRFIYVNNAACETRGYTRNELMKLTLRDLDTPEYARMIKPRIEEITEKGSMIFEAVHRRKDGSVMPVEAHVSLIKLDGKKLFLSTIRDITKRKRSKNALISSEVRYRRLFEAAEDGILILDAETGQIVDANKFVINLLGFSHQQFLGKKIWDVGFFKDIIANKDNFEELKRKRYIRYDDMPLKAADGRQIDVEFISNVYIEDDLKVIQCNIRNITERKKLEHQLLQSQKMESIGALASGVAHDFNNILTAINGYAEITIEDIGKNHPSRESLEHIKDGVVRAANLTRQLLIFSRHDEFNAKPINFNALFDNLQNMLIRLIGENITIETKLSPDLAMIKADAGNIEQVITNLVINARDAMPQGGRITVKIENVTVDEEYCRLNMESSCGDFVRLSVTDTGTGMTKDVLKHIFEPFFTTKPHGKGTGLGLSVVYGIVKKHNGWINTYSEPGHGTLFNIYLPVYTGKEHPELTPKKPALEELKGAGQRILLVEDDVAILKMTEMVLSKAGYTVLGAPNGLEARRIFAQNNIDLVLSDVILPDINGLELVAEFLQLKPGLPIILSSGYSRSGDEIRNSKIPFLPKPYNIKDLLKIIKDTLAKI
ncbi:MAG: PAS domain S-box protein [Candidatus Brocadiia bacterium]